MLGFGVRSMGGIIGVGDWRSAKEISRSYDELDRGCDDRMVESEGDAG